MAKKIKSKAQVTTKTNIKTKALAIKKPKSAKTKSLATKSLNSGKKALVATNKKPQPKKKISNTTKTAPAETSKKKVANKTKKEPISRKKENQTGKKIMMTQNSKLQKEKIKKNTAQLAEKIANVDTHSSTEEYMNTEQLERFRDKLLQWKEELLSGAVNTVQDMQSTSANFPDPVDRASLEEEFSLELRTRDRERKLLKKIEEALQRINESNYGYCDDCGAEIGVNRLEARPTATQCIECKTVAEMREKQIGDIGKSKEEE